MIRSLISATAIWAVGCVVPAPLAREDTPSVPHPQITRGTPDFVTGVYSIVTSADTFELNADVRYEGTESLHARIYLKDGPQITTADSAELQPVRANFYRATFTQSWCHKSTAPNIPFVLYLYVADSPFSNVPVPNETAPDIYQVHGNYDFKSWTFLCV